MIPCDVSFLHTFLKVKETKIKSCDDRINQRDGLLKLFLLNLSSLLIVSKMQNKVIFDL